MEMLANQCTEHGRKRLQQRGIPDSAVDLVLTYGVLTQKQGATRMYLNSEGRRRLERCEGKQALRKTGHKLDIFVVVGDDGRLITAAYRTRRIHR